MFEFLILQKELLLLLALIGPGGGATESLS